MMKKIWKQLKNRKGFTLIELIVVIAVLGILAAVALPRVGNVTNDARENATAQELRLLNDALERYIAESGDSGLSELDDYYISVENGSGIDLNADSLIEAFIEGISTEQDTTPEYGPYIKSFNKDSEGNYILSNGKAVNFDSDNHIFTD